MLKWYYIVCVDTIARLKSMPNTPWKFGSIMYLSTFVGMMLMALVILFEGVFPDYAIISLKELPLGKLGGVFFVLPILPVNYFLLFYNDRHEVLMTKYKSNNGKYFLRFTMLSLGLFFISLVFA
jgi:hypothetical protein